MGRPRGSHNAGYEETRAQLARALLGRLLEPDGATVSFREMAAAAGVSASTLRHYFGDRAGTLKAVLEEARRGARPFIEAAADADHGPVGPSLKWLLESLWEAWTRFRVGEVHTLGVAAGLRDEVLGPAYVDEVLEPTLQATEARLARHVGTGELGPCDVRHAALELVAPLVLALLHQESLFGARCRPLDVGAFLDDHLARFLRAHGAGAARAAG